MTPPLSPEFKALRAIARGIDQARLLDAPTRRRVFGWLQEKSYSEVRKAHDTLTKSDQRDQVA